ncbi:putative replication protein O of bacteriophage [Escherichia coli]|uniref:Putative replication protein O of bacteriophage n=1 Tax=Escherichia coli TaxID=562 RepID=A0A2X3KEB2_ECOLX|nr:putative replication protein O of bacteriophage [Escherichia coli]
MNIIKQQGGMFGPNKTSQNGVSLKTRENPPKRGDKTSLKLGDCYPQNRGTQKTLIQKKIEKIIRQRILANPLTSQKRPFCGET